MGFRELQDLAQNQSNQSEPDLRAKLHIFSVYIGALAYSESSYELLSHKGFWYRVTKHGSKSQAVCGTSWLFRRVHSWITFCLCCMLYRGEWPLYICILFLLSLGSAVLMKYNRQDHCLPWKILSFLQIAPVHWPFLCRKKCDLPNPTPWNLLRSIGVLWCLRTIDPEALSHKSLQLEGY